MKSIVKQIKLFDKNNPLKLDCGESLHEVEIAYTTYGNLNNAGDNVILICHALSGDAHVAGKLELTEELISGIPLYSAMKKNQQGWWDVLIGPGKIIDTEKYFVISSNIIGSCYGSTGPTSINPLTGKKYGANFPQVSVRDIVKVQRKLIDYLKVKKIKSIIGGSLGGMQALEWAIMYPEIVQSIIPIATALQHSPWAIAFNHAGRNAIINDPAFNNGNYGSEYVHGLSIARQIGMISYRTGKSFGKRFSRERMNPENHFDKKNLFQVESYLNYQGEKLVNRFDPNSYIIISKILDLHDVALNRGKLKDVTKQIKAKTLCIGIDTDILYPADEQKEIAALIPNGDYKEIISEDGHDGFLIEFVQLGNFIKPFLNSLD